jgi:hypothetical protein
VPGQQDAPIAAKDSNSAAEVLALEKKIEDAVVRGDVAFVDGVLASDFSDGVKTEVHGDIVITYGRYVIWFERVYAKRNGKWQLLSHRTGKVHLFRRQVSIPLLKSRRLAEAPFPKAMLR